MPNLYYTLISPFTYHRIWRVFRTYAWDSSRVRNGGRPTRPTVVDARVHRKAVALPWSSPQGKIIFFRLFSFVSGQIFPVFMIFSCFYHLERCRMRHVECSAIVLFRIRSDNHSPHATS